MRNPNGYGTVVKLSGNRRKPFAVRKTTGFNEKGQPVYLNIGYTETREEGLILLANYNKSPWDVDSEKMTLTELFEFWKDKKMPKLGKASQTALRTAFKHTTKFQGTPYKNIKTMHMQDCVDGCGYGRSTQAAIKNLFNHLDDLAFEMDIINKKYAQIVTIAPLEDSEKHPFSDEEVDTLWDRQEEPWVDTVLMLLYTGFRISELLDLRIANIDLEAGTMKGGTKTAAGKNRIVPIHSKIKHLIEARFDEEETFLIRDDKNKGLYKENYYPHWNKIKSDLNMEHTPHECRHTFRTRLDNANGNRVCINLVMGHKSSEIGERTYTHKDVQQLKDTVELITN